MVILISHNANNSFYIPSKNSSKHSYNSNSNLANVSESEEEQENKDQDEKELNQSSEWFGDRNKIKFHPPAIVGSSCSTPTPPPQTKTHIPAKRNKTTTKKMATPRPKPSTRMGKHVSLNMLFCVWIAYWPRRRFLEEFR